MKVPSAVTGRVRPGSGPSLAYTQGNANNGLAPIARSLGGLGEAVSQLEATFQQRDKQTDRFNSLRGLSEFQTAVATDLTELKRNYQADGKGFAGEASTLYDKLADNYMANVPQDLQEEFKYRVTQSKQGVLGDALKFQYEAGDAWFKQGVDDELNKSKTLLDQNPGLLDAQQSHMMEVIDATDLPLIEKEDLKRKVNIGLAAVQYKTRVRNDATVLGSIGVGPIEDGNVGAAGILRKEEGFRATPYWDVNAYRIGYGSDTITRADGSIVKVAPGMSISREDAERDLERRTREFGSVAARQVGPDMWAGLPANVQAGLISVTYNYGELPSSVVTAVKSGSTPAIAEAVANLSANKNRRANEAAIINGTAGIEADPQYANIPYEDKIALRNDAEREANEQLVAEAKGEKQRVDGLQNDLFLGLLDGGKGQVDIDNARAEGWLSTYEDVNKAQGILKTKVGGDLLAGQAVEKLNGGGSWDPASVDDKKMLNALVGRSGLQQVTDGNQEYINNNIVPLVNQTGDIPTDVAGTLIGMVRGADNNKALFALDALAQLRDVNPYAFNTRVNSDIAQSVELWDARKDLAQDKTALLSDIRGGTTQAERQARQVLREEARGILSQTSNGVANVKNLISTAQGEFGSFFSSPNIYSNPLANQAFEKEFSTLFIDKYSMTGNVDTAVDLTSKELQRNWGVTSVGDSKLLMKYPPEKSGYRPINGNYDWINKSVRWDLKLGDDESFELFSDEQTRQEFQAFQRDPNATAPSYRIFTIDSDGVARERVDEAGKPLRINFKPPQDELKKEADIFDWKVERARVEEVINNYPRLAAGALAGGVKLSPEDQKDYEDALKARDALDKNNPAIEPPIPVAPENPYQTQFPTGSF
jgi:GH24 family phage-related lysozyme (muramidase)